MFGQIRLKLLLKKLNILIRYLIITQIQYFQLYRKSFRQRLEYGVFQAHAAERQVLEGGAVEEAFDEGLGAGDLSEFVGGEVEDLEVSGGFFPQVMLGQ